MSMQPTNNHSMHGQDRDDQIRVAQNAVISRMQADPEKARSSIVTTGRVVEGLACHVQQGKFTATTDLGHGMGGDAAGPSPGFFARTGIVGCVAIAIKMLAARRGHSFNAVEVSIETDFDDAALFGIGDRTAAPLETRLNVVVETGDSNDIVQSVVRDALAMDPWFLGLRDPQIVKTQAKVGNVIEKQ